MNELALAIVVLAFSSPVMAEEFLCTYAWPDQDESHSVLLDVDGNSAVIRGGALNVEYKVAANSPTELLIYQPFTKANSGAAYPVGFSTMVLDKTSREFVYSNNFVSGNANNYAKGKCEVVLRD